MWTVLLTVPHPFSLALPCALHFHLSLGSVSLGAGPGASWSLVSWAVYVLWPLLSRSFLRDELKWSCLWTPGPRFCHRMNSTGMRWRLRATLTTWARLALTHGQCARQAQWCCGPWSGRRWWRHQHPFLGQRARARHRLGWLRWLGGWLCREVGATEADVWEERKHCLPPVPPCFPRPRASCSHDFYQLKAAGERQWGWRNVVPQLDTWYHGRELRVGGRQGAGRAGTQKASEGCPAGC